MPEFRHVKRGTLYRTICEAEVQASEPIKEGQTIVVYRGSDGKAWARPVTEFYDGRFVEVR